MSARRAIRWLLGVARALAAAAATTIVLAWIASRVATDRLGWSQYAWWIPTLAWAAASILSLAAWTALARLHRRLERARRGPPSTIASPDPTAARRPNAVGRISRPLLAAIVLLLLARAAVFEWRLYRFVTPTPDHPRGIRIANWNPAIPAKSLEPILAAEADVYLIANEWQRNAAEELVQELGDGVDVIQNERLMVVSRLPVRAWASTYLGLAGRVLRSYQLKDLDAQVAEQVDQGRALFVELETPTGDPLVIWLVDLPSDPRLLRNDVTATAADAIGSFKGRVYRYDAEGRRTVTDMSDGFPDPDLILGDFNIPRDSASLRTLVGDRANAYDQAGRGYAATFPRTFPLAQIDQMFVGDDWRTVSYRLLDPGRGLHLAQVAEIIPTPAKP